MIRPPDPYAALAEALRALVEDAVARAVAGSRTGEGEGAVLVSIPEAARQLGLGITKLKELIASGEIESRIAGRRRLVPTAALTAFGTRGTPAQRQPAS